MTEERDADNNPAQHASKNQMSDGGVPEEEELRTSAHTHVPVVIDAAPDRPPDRRPVGLLGVLVGIALVVSLISLGLSLSIIYSLSNAQRAAVEGIDSAISALDNLEGEGLHYEYGFQQEFQVSSSIPIEEEIVIPFSGDFPIETTVQVPLDAGVLGRFMFDLPINTSVQVDTEVPIRVDQTFEISTTIPLSMVIPIDVRLDDPQLQRGVAGLRAWLVELRDSMDTGLRFPLPGD